MRHNLRVAWHVLRADPKYYARGARQRIAWGYVRKALALPDTVKHPVAYVRLARFAKRHLNGGTD